MKFIPVITYQIVLAKGDKVIYNFEIAGETWYNGHKYNELNEWAFRALCDGIKPKEKKPPKLKKIVVMSTERQLKKAKQLFYAKNIGFSITAKDYQRWHFTLRNRAQKSKRAFRKSKRWKDFRRKNVS